MARPKAEPRAGEPLAVYLHWPYCARICSYCDFNVHLDRRAGEGERLAGAMAEDIKRWCDWTGPRTVSSVHFGGGTPSLMTPAQLEGLLSQIDASWGLPPEAELALEANPNAVTPEAVTGWRAAGLTRLSIGVQSFDDAVLKRLGRDHDGGQARGAVQRAVAAFRSVSADLIFGVAGEPAGRLERDLDGMLALGVPHLSTYQLTVEPGTAFARAEARGDERAVGETRSADDFECIQTRLTDAGYDHYEVSNFAKPGHESRHNLAYWRGWDYAGIGPGAHGRLWTAEGRVATEAVRSPARYIEAQEGGPFHEVETMDAEAALSEHVMMGLRIADGVSLERLSALRGAPVTIDPDLIDAGWLQVEEGRVRATPEGRMVLDALTRAILLG